MPKLVDYKRFLLIERNLTHDRADDGLNSTLAELQFPRFCQNQAIGAMMSLFAKTQDRPKTDLTDHDLRKSRTNSPFVNNGRT